MTATCDLTEVLRCVNRVNVAEVMGKPPGTLLFQFYDAKPADDGTWTVRCHLCYDPAGWNTIPGPDGKRYPVVNVTTGEPLYPPVDFPPQENGLTYEMTGRNTEAMERGWATYWAEQPDEPIILPTRPARA